MSKQRYPVFAVTADDFLAGRDRSRGLAMDAAEALEVIREQLLDWDKPLRARLASTVFCEFWLGNSPAIIAASNGLPKGSWHVERAGSRQFMHVTGWFLAKVEAAAA